MSFEPSTYDDVDPFEARCYFGDLLSRLSNNASFWRAAFYALENKKLHDDFTTCIVERLQELRDINMRAHYIYLLDYICHLSYKEKSHEYLDSIKKKFPTFFDLIVPLLSTSSTSTLAPTDTITPTLDGRVNFGIVVKAVKSWKAKGIFPKEDLDFFESIIQSKKPIIHASCPKVTPQRDPIPLLYTQYLPPGAATNLPTTVPTIKHLHLSHQFPVPKIFERIETDRERSKKYREEAWSKPEFDTDPAEFQRFWVWEPSKSGTRDWWKRNVKLGVVNSSGSIEETNVNGDEGTNISDIDEEDVDILVKETKKVHAWRQLSNMNELEKKWKRESDRVIKRKKRRTGR